MSSGTFGEPLSKFRTVEFWGFEPGEYLSPMNVFAGNVIDLPAQVAYRGAGGSNNSAEFTDAGFQSGFLKITRVIGYR